MATLAPSSTTPVAVAATRRAPATWLLFVVAPLAGVLLGAADLEAQRVFAYPWANLANSAAVWAVAAFALGVWSARGVARTAAAGIVLLAVAVESYYAAAVVLQHDDVSSLTSQTTQMWLFVSIMAGALFGAAGVGMYADVPWVRTVCTAIGPSVLFAEAANTLRRGSFTLSSPLMSVQSAALAAALGVVLLAALALVVRRSVTEWCCVVLACVPVTLVGFALYSMTRYGG